MAKLLLSCDEYIYRHQGRYYASNQEKFNFYSRYLRVFENVRFAVRCIDEEKLKPSRVLFEGPNIEIFPLPIFHGPKEYLKKYFETGKVIEHVVDGCDAAVLRLPSTVAQRISKKVLRKGIPYATEIVFDACDGADTSTNLLEKILWRIIDKQMRSTCYKADGVAPVTQHYLQKRYFSKKNDSFASYYSSLELVKEFFTGPRKFPENKRMLIAHVDNQIGLFSRKGTAEIIRALELLKNEGLIVNVEFAGDDWDNSTQKILAYAKEHGVENQVSCPGFLNRAQLAEFLDRADLFVLPTKAEGLPRVIIEAIAKGLPCVTTPASGNPELIPSNYLVGYSDVIAIAEKIKTLVTDKTAYEKASEENFEHSLEYEASILEVRRDAFYHQLKNRI